MPVRQIINHIEGNLQDLAVISRIDNSLDIHSFDYAYILGLFHDLIPFLIRFILTDRCMPKVNNNWMGRGLERKLLRFKSSCATPSAPKAEALLTRDAIIAISTTSGMYVLEKNMWTESTIWKNECQIHSGEEFCMLAKSGGTCMTLPQVRFHVLIFHPT